MNSSEMLSESDDEKLYKIFGRQKVKLYKIKHFIFDFGGVMVEKTFVLKNLFQIIENDLKITLPQKEEDPYIKKLRRSLSSGRIDSRQFLENIFEKYCYPYQKKDGALPAKKANVEYYLELWFHLYSQLTNLSSEMEEIIERLHQAGYTVSLMSNTFDIHARSNELKGFYHLFDHVFLSNEIGYRKPDLEKYKYVLKKLDSKPKSCIFIDDKISNLVPARELKIIAFKFESLEKFKEQLAEIGIKEISKDLRQEIKEKYKKYKLSKKEYKKAKKLYKQAKKDFLKKRKTSLRRRIEYKKRRLEYENKKREYLRLKQRKEEEFVSKVDVV